MFLPHPRVKVSIVGSLRDREVACSASDRQGSNFESCVWRTVSSQSSHHPQEVLLAQFSLYVHKGGLKPDSFHFISGSQNLPSTFPSLAFTLFPKRKSPDREVNQSAVCWEIPDWIEVSTAIWYTGQMILSGVSQKTSCFHRNKHGTLTQCRNGAGQHRRQWNNNSPTLDQCHTYNLVLYPDYMMI